MLARACLFSTDQAKSHGQKHLVSLFVQQVACNKGQYFRNPVLSLVRIYQPRGVKNWHSSVISGSFSAQTKMAVFSSGYTSLHRRAEIIGGNNRKKKNIRKEQEWKWMVLEQKGEKKGAE